MYSSYRTDDKTLPGPACIDITHTLAGPAPFRHYTPLSCSPMRSQRLANWAGVNGFAIDCSDSNMSALAFAVLVQM